MTMKILILETENTLSGSIDDMLKRFCICHSHAQKRQVLQLFKHPTITKDAFLLAEAERIDRYFV